MIFEEGIVADNKKYRIAGNKRMYQILVKNCNSISNGSIEIAENKLNIKYGINGTGKTTIARALELSTNTDKLQELKSYFATDPASVTVTPGFGKILVFNEEFVNQVVFKEDEVIEKSFEVFLKTPTYDSKKEQLDRHLASLHQIMEQDSEIIELQEQLNKISAKFKRTGSGKLSKTGAFKSLLSKQNLYNVPCELDGYKDFFENKDINIPWIDWKNKGDAYDVGQRCPYCSETVNRVEHDKRKEIFKKNYTKSDSQNLKEILELLESLQQYIQPSKYSELIYYVKNDTPEDVINAIMDKLIVEFDLMLSRFTAIKEFGNRKIVIADISKLEQQVVAMEFPKTLFEIFGGDKINGVFNRINENVEKLKEEATALKREMGELKGVMQATIVASQTDINEFLKTAGINYELVIQAEDESNSRTILQQCFSEDKTDVTKIRQHLSWGEKNAFSLILFMYYANLQNPDLIILDDPISSFDSNKKYAILHRMFKSPGNKNVTLAGKTVLLLTHDFEPITDFLVVGKLDESKAVASFLCNVDGTVSETFINPEEDVKLIIEECENIASNTDINIVSRVVFLRKLCELNTCRGIWGNVYEILSCLIHVAEIKRKIANNVFVDMDEKELQAGLQKIREYIPDFCYDDLKKSTYTLEKIKELYNAENNAYLKVQLFRALKDIVDEKKLRLAPMDDAWYKFIDETYHIENDYLHYLDILKFNIVPDYIMKKINEMMEAL